MCNSYVGYNQGMKGIVMKFTNVKRVLLWQMVKDRYSSWDSGIGAEIEAGKHDFNSSSLLLNDTKGIPLWNHNYFECVVSVQNYILIFQSCHKQYLTNVRFEVFTSVTTK